VHAVGLGTGVRYFLARLEAARQVAGA